MKMTIEKDKVMGVALAMLAVYATMLMPTEAWAGAVAGTSDGISDVLCKVVTLLTGPIGSAIATLAIIVVGIGALMGKVSWGMAIIVGIGVGVVFGAPMIVQSLDTSGQFVSC